ncbi:ArdC family protein [Shewanella oncorhynchi]|uniref:ArdC family protein n=1 Tax=Shewanella oncorhynchi TaxID=2726434 RepID=UPI001039A663
MIHSITTPASHTKPFSEQASLQATSRLSKDDISKSKTKSKSAKAFKKVDMYQVVTAQIIAALDKGVKPWVCPWQRNSIGAGLPINFDTKKAYSGINVLLLWAAAFDAGFSSNQFLTYNQANNLGGQVRKGEKGTSIIFYKSWEKENEQGEKEVIPMLKSFTVFNVEQIDGLNVEEVKGFNVNNSFDAIDHVESFINKTGANIVEQGDKAFFRPSTDNIVLPTRERFSNSLDFYCTALHELTHWTGAKSRLDRIKGSRFGSDDYAFEELIAELGASFLMAELNISGDVQHESYIASWLTQLKNDKRYIFKAASAASKAHQYLIELTTQEIKKAA